MRWDRELTDIAREDGGKTTDDKRGSSVRANVPLPLALAAAVGHARGEDEDEGAEESDKDEADLVLGPQERLGAFIDGVVDLDKLQRDETSAH